MKHKNLLILLVLLCLALPFVSSATVFESHNISLATLNSDSSERGMKILVLTENVNLVNISKTPSDTASRCRVYNSTLNLLATGSYVNNNCSVQIPLKIANTYYILSDASGSVFNNYFASKGTVPVQGVNINITDATDSGFGSIPNFHTVTGVHVTISNDSFITFNYPSNSESFTFSYKGFINFTSTPGANNCTINDTRWTQNYVSSTFWSFQNNTDIPEGAYSIRANCTNSALNTLSFSINESFQFGRCNSTVNSRILNITTLDEGNQTPLVSTVSGLFTYWVNDRSVNKMFTLNEAGLSNYTFCISPNSSTFSFDYYIDYSASSFQERRVTKQDVMYSSYTTVPLYLLHDNYLNIVSFNLVDQFSNPITGVYSKVTKSIGGSMQVIETRYTDSSGLVTFFLNSLDEYTFTFEKSGYTTQTFSLRPTQTQTPYIVSMATGLSGVSFTSLATGVNTRFMPDGITNVSTVYNFNFTVNSTVWDVTNCTFQIRNTTGHVVASGNTTKTLRYCYGSVNFNTSNYTKFYSYATVVYNDTYVEYYSKPYNPFLYNLGNYSLITVLDDIKNLSGSGLNAFSRLFIAFLVVFFASIIIVRSIGFDINTTGIIILLIIWILSYTNFFYLGNFNAPSTLGAFEESIRQYLVLIVSGIIWLSSQTIARLQ